MANVKDIIETIGRDRISERLGVSQSAISNAAAAGVFPTSWLRGLQDLWGAPLDLSLFGPWRRPRASRDEAAA